MSATEDHFRWLQHHRDIETPCGRCHGFGTATYGSTATWRGGMGGASMTKDVCDLCWGSGDSAEPWTDLRKLRAEEDHRVALAAGNLLAERCGAWLSSLLPALDELCLELDKFERQRRQRTDGFDVVTRSLAKVLREIATAKRRGPTSAQTEKP